MKHVHSLYIFESVISEQHTKRDKVLAALLKSTTFYLLHELAELQIQ